MDDIRDFILDLTGFLIPAMFLLMIIVLCAACVWVVSYFVSDIFSGHMLSDCVKGCI